MPDTDDPDTTGQRTAGSRLDALERASDEAKEHRTRINTIVSIVGGAFLLIVGGLANSAMSTRDTAIANGSRLNVVEQRVAAVDARDQRRDEAERTTREQLVEIRADVRALREQLDTLTRALAHEDTRAPRGR